MTWVSKLESQPLDYGLYLLLMIKIQIPQQGIVFWWKLEIQQKAQAVSN